MIRCPENGWALSCLSKSHSELCVNKTFHCITEKSGLDSVLQQLVVSQVKWVLRTYFKEGPEIEGNINERDFRGGPSYFILHFNIYFVLYDEKP